MQLKMYMETAYYWESMVIAMLLLHNSAILLQKL